MHLLAKRIGIGVLVATGSSFVSRSRETWEANSAAIPFNAFDHLAVPIVGGILAGGVFHTVIGQGEVTRLRYYLAWISAATAAVVPILLPEARADRDWALLAAAPLFGVVVGLGWGLFIRRVEGFDY